MSSTASRSAWVQITGAIGGRGDLGDSDLGVGAVRVSAVREDDDAVRSAQATRILFCMMFSDADLRAFSTAYERDFGKTISLAEAQEMATRVLAFFELLASDPAQDTDSQVP